MVNDQAGPAAQEPMAAVGEPDSVRSIELRVDAEIERDSRAQWTREALGIAATVAGVAAVGSAVAAAPEALAAAAIATGAGAAIGRVAAFVGTPRSQRALLRSRSRRGGPPRHIRPDPLTTFAPARLAARQHLTLAAKDASLVEQEASPA